MIIGIIAQFNQREEGSGPLEDVAYEVISRLAGGHPEHQFVIFHSGAAEGIGARLSDNAILVRKPLYRHPLLQKLWYDVPLNGLVKRYKIDVLLSMEGFCSATVKVPQCLMWPGGYSSQSGPSSTGNPRFYHWLLPRLFARAALIVAGSLRHQAHLRSFTKSGGKNVAVIYGGVNAGKGMLSAAEKAAVRQHHTGGVEYFIYTGTLQKEVVLPLLKGFSIFKKRQRTSWKLVLNETGAVKEEGWAQLLGSYKYRDDVVVTGLLKNEEQDRLKGSAYGAIDPQARYDSIHAALGWLARGVPYIAAEGNPVQEIDPQAGLFFRPDEPADIAERLMELYKDEALHTRLSANGVQLALTYNWQSTADAIWNRLVSLVGARSA